MKISQKEFVVIRSYLEKESSIVIDEKKKYLVESRLSRLVVESGRESFADFCDYIETTKDISIRDKIVDAMTTNETLWFRDGSPWVAFQDVILPELVQIKKEKQAKRFRIWSAACSTGQEPYTVAMLINEFHLNPKGKDLRPDTFEILGTDISTSALFIAMAGRFDRLAMDRGLTNQWKRFRDKYFKNNGEASEISTEIKKRVNFKGAVNFFV
jgi:chemotaxis protein methyltransferase CheR